MSRAILHSPTDPREFNRRQTLQTLLALAAGVICPAHAGTVPLRFGIHPFNSTLALLRNYRPLRDFLEERLAQPVTLYTARDFSAYLAAMRQGDFELAVSPPHFAALCEDVYEVLFRYQVALRPLMVVANDSPLDHPSQLRGKRLALADRIAFIPIVAVKWLADLGLQPGRDYTLTESPSHAAAVANVALGLADATIVTQPLLAQTAAEVRAQVRSISTGLVLPNVYLLARRDLGQARIGQLRQTLLDFAADPQRGQPFMEHTRYQGLAPVTEAEAASVRQYVNIFHTLAGANAPVSPRN